jgi:hypothetical protein
MFGSVSHSRKHRIDSTRDHKPIPGDHDENSVVVMDGNGLPVKDSGIQISTLLNGLKPQGGWDASGGTYPTPTSVGDFWWITVAGVIGGVQYNVNDWIVYVNDDPVDWQKVDNSEFMPGEVFFTGQNITNQTMLKGKIAYISNPVGGGTPGIAWLHFGRNTTDSEALQTIGMVCQTLAEDETGLVKAKGMIEVDTTVLQGWSGETWSEGQVLYLDDSNYGNLTNVRPTAKPSNIVRIGWLIKHDTTGAILLDVEIFQDAKTTLITDVDSLFESANVEDALQELRASRTKHAWVSYANGSDTTGDGTVDRPYQTSQGAVNDRLATDDFVEIISDMTNPSTEVVVIPSAKWCSIMALSGQANFMVGFNIILSDGCYFQGNNIQIDVLDGTAVLSEAYCILEECRVNTLGTNMTFVKLFLNETLYSGALADPNGNKVGLSHQEYPTGTFWSHFWQMLCMNNNRITKLASPVDGTDAVNKSFMENATRYRGCLFTGDDVENGPNEVWTVLGTDFGINEQWDTDNFHSVSVNTGRVVIPTGMSGKYEVKAQVIFQAKANGIRGIAVYKNGVMDQLSRKFINPVGNTENTTIDLNYIMNLVAGDYIEIAVYQDSGLANDIQTGSSYMAVSRIGGV